MLELVSESGPWLRAPVGLEEAEPAGFEAGSPEFLTGNDLTYAMAHLRKKWFCSAVPLLCDIIFLPSPHNNSVAVCLLDLVHPRPKPHNLP